MSDMVTEGGWNKNEQKNEEQKKELKFIMAEDLHSYSSIILEM